MAGSGRPGSVHCTVRVPTAIAPVGVGSATGGRAHRVTPAAATNPTAPTTAATRPARRAPPRVATRGRGGPIASAAGNPPTNSSAVSSALIGGKIVEPAPPRRQPPGVRAGWGSAETE